MSDQQQNAELATDLDNDLTLFLVYRLLICLSIDAVENRKQDSKKQQSRTVWRTLSRLVGNRKKKEAEVVGQSVVDLARLWKSCQRWWWNDCGPAGTRSMPILQVKTQESIKILCQITRRQHLHHRVHPPTVSMVKHHPSSTITDALYCPAREGKWLRLWASYYQESQASDRALESPKTVQWWSRRSSALLRGSQSLAYNIYFFIQIQTTRNTSHHGTESRK